MLLQGTHITHKLAQCYLNVDLDSCKCVLQTLEQPLKTSFKKVSRICSERSEDGIILTGQLKPQKAVKQEEQRQQIEKVMKMVDINLVISLITLNVSSLNSPSKRQLSEWIKKCDSTMQCLQEIHLKYKDTNTKTKQEQLWSFQMQLTSR